jgi:hypothetical protein
MTLYQEVPKTLIVVELRKRYSAEELESVELNELLHSCYTMNQLFNKLNMMIHNKVPAPKKYEYINQERFQNL